VLSATLLVVAAAGSVSAQARFAGRPSRAFALFRAAPTVPPTRPTLFTKAPVARTYWLEGGVVGAIGLGLFTAVLDGGLCESQNCTGSTVAGAVFGGGLGFAVGALVGGQFRKPARDTASSP